MNKVALWSVIYVLAFALVAGPAFGEDQNPDLTNRVTTTEIPTHASLNSALLYYNMYVGTGKPCPKTVRSNAQRQIDLWLEGNIAGWAATMEKASDIEAFLVYYRGCLKTGRRCSTVLTKVPHKVVQNVGRALSVGLNVALKLTEEGNCMAAPQTQKKQYELYIEAVAAKAVWEAVIAECK